MKKRWIGMMVFAAVAALAGTAQAALLAEFTFDSDTTDTAGGHDGILGAGASVAGGVLSIDTAGGYMDLASTFAAVNPMGGSSDFRIEMDYKTTTGATLLGLSAGVADPLIPDLTVWIRGNREWLYHDNYYAGDPRIAVSGIKDGTWKTLVIEYISTDSPVISFTTDGVTGTSTIVPNRDVSGDTLRIGGTTNPGAVNLSSAGMAFDNIRIYAIPEPGTLGMIALCGGGLLFIRRIFAM